MSHLSAREQLGRADVLFLTLDTLRYDVAQRAHELGETPCLSALLPASGWQRRHSPASFTYAAHHAFFAGFLPTPVAPEQVRQPRLFATEFAGSETTGPDTLVFATDNIIRGYAEAGYHTLCIGGVGFFNPHTALGRVLPAYFQEAHWRAEFGVTEMDSPRYQVELACQRLAELPIPQRLFLFINLSACHQPNCHYLPGACEDSPDSQRAALRHIDAALPALFASMQRRAPVLSVICADHGTAYGEDGYQGHRLAHPVVMEVPYWQGLLPQCADEDNPS